jgi:hypothetical protein
VLTFIGDNQEWTPRDISALRKQDVQRVAKAAVEKAIEQGKPATPAVVHEAAKVQIFHAMFFRLVVQHMTIPTFSYLLVCSLCLQSNGAQLSTLDLDADKASMAASNFRFSRRKTLEDHKAASRHSSALATSEIFFARLRSCGQRMRCDCNSRHRHCCSAFIFDSRARRNQLPRIAR